MSKKPRNRLILQKTMLFTWGALLTVAVTKDMSITSSKTLAHSDFLLRVFTCLSWLLTSLFKRVTVSSACQNAPSRKGSAVVANVIQYQLSVWFHSTFFSSHRRGSVKEIICATLASPEAHLGKQPMEIRLKTAFVVLQSSGKTCCKVTARYTQIVYND